ncbi:MAG: DUF2130 domain-containing protein [Acidiferrobacterales bacterium]|nr:DUF2130 domain-containing protein [Acidiferrobacterales bacterium]
MSQANTTQCPNCGTEINVNELLYQELEKQAQQKFQSQLAEEKNRIAQQQKQLAQQRQQIEQTIQTQLAETLATERAKLQKQLQQDQAERIKSMETELAESSKKVIDLNKAQSEVEKLKREKDALRTEIELESEKKLSEELAAQSTKLQQQVNAQVEFKIAEKEQVINQLKQKLSEAQQQADQGSTQLQGEVQELAIEEWLRNQFPFDTIEEIKKGANGADCMQIVNTQERENCGAIYYESKRTKTFQPSWIAKFKTDIQDKGANVGVLVTQSMPKDMTSLGQLDGVWVCTFDEFKNLSQVLRQSLIQISQTLITQENKGEKMGMLYDYLTGNEFQMQIEAIVEGFTQLKSDLESEKRSMQSIWKKREKQIERVLLNTNYMYSSVKGIAGNAVQNVSLLELNSDLDAADEH